jgi:hypothetical protein
MKTTHTHRGTCQACGSVQAVDNNSYFIAKHGYKVEYGRFQFVCNAAGSKPAEHDVSFTHDTIASCLKAAESHEADAAALRSGEYVPPLFKRWNPRKEKITRTRGGGERKSMGDYDILPIAQATEVERRDTINSAIADHEMNASGFRGHVAFLRRDVLTRFGQPLYPNEELTKTALTKGLKFKHEGTEYELQRPAYSTFGNRLIGWYVLRVGETDKTRGLRWTTKEIRNAMNPKPVKVEGAYATKKARKDDLDALNRKYEAARKVIQDTYLALPHEERTEAKTEIYYGPMQLNHWRPKHSAAVLKEFPQLATVVANIEALVVERERVKNAP